jgi:hypothetical protein
VVISFAMDSDDEEAVAAAAALIMPKGVPGKEKEYGPNHGSLIVWSLVHTMRWSRNSDSMTMFLTETSSEWTWHLLTSC